MRITASPAESSTQSVPDRHAVAHGSTCDPLGVPSAAKSGSLPLGSTSVGALIGKLRSQGAIAFLVGQSREMKIEEEGHLYLGPNSDGPSPCQGSFSVTVQVLPATAATTAGTGAHELNSQSAANQNVKSKLAAAAQTWLSGQFGTGAPSNNSAGSSSAVGGTTTSGGASNAAASTNVKDVNVSAAPLDGKLRDGIDHLPRRVNDKFNNLGDMVNFVIIGSQKDVEAALDAANWHVADRSTSTAIAKAVLMATEKQDYLQMPMSQLYLFGRVQDYGYEQAEPYAVVASRHHFRIWKAPFEFNGQQVWVGAGTHDIGFEKDQRNGQVTHKIDPAVDGERENIASSLQKSGKTKSVTYYLPPSPVQDARNATGGGYHSDGRIVVIEVK
jgi:hypothetical protein